MSIRGVCVDSGRLIIHEPSVARVEGRTTFANVPGQWFRCRLFLNDSNDQPDIQKAHWTSVPQPQVMAVTTDLDGTTLEFHGDFRIEINSVQLGHAMWRMEGEPQPIRKKRRLIGWLLTVERVIEREADDLLNQNTPNVLTPADLS